MKVSDLIPITIIWLYRFKMILHGCPAEWCTVISVEDNKQHVCSAKALETESSEIVTEADLHKGKELIWRYKGTPLTVEVIQVHGKWSDVFLVLE